MQTALHFAKIVTNERETRNLFRFFHSECRKSYLKIQTNERETRNLFRYFSQRVQKILSKDSNKRARNTKLVSIFFTASAENLRDFSQRHNKETKVSMNFMKVQFTLHNHDYFLNENSNLNPPFGRLVATIVPP